MVYPILVPPKRIKLQPDYSTLYTNGGIQQINESAASILGLCTGMNSVQDIIDRLVLKYDEKEEKVTAFVRDFLEHSANIGTINLSEHSIESTIDIIGSEEYWTPDSVVIETTHNCPLSCRHCFLDAGHGANIDRTKLENLCKEAIDIGVNMVQLTGGEPLIYPGIEEIIQISIQGNTRLGITTSGFVSSPRIYEALGSMKGKGWVQISLDGLEDTHNNMRNHPHSYSKAVDFISKLVSMGIDVHIATCVTDISVDELQMLCQKVKDLGARVHRIGVVTERGRAKVNKIGSPASLRQRVAKDVMKLKMLYESQSFRIAGFEDKDLVKHPGIKNCGAGYRVLKISPDGKIHPCPMMDLPIGTTRHNSLSEFSQKMGGRFAKIQSPSKEFCEACPNLSFCDGCVSEALLYRNTVEKCSWSESQNIDAVFSVFT